MPSSGKPVHEHLTTGGKSRVLSSTPIRLANEAVQLARVKLSVIPQFAAFFPQYFSPLKIAPPPLVEHYFYPVSTAPINTPIKLKLKKGSK